MTRSCLPTLSTASHVARSRRRKTTPKTSMSMSTMGEGVWSSSVAGVRSAMAIGFAGPLRRSPTRSQSASSRPSRCCCDSRPAAPSGSSTTTRLLRYADSITACFSQVSVRPSMRRALSLAATAAARSAAAAREGDRDASRTDVVEQRLGVEVELRELFGRLHADRRGRGRHRALHERQVEFAAHERAEPVDRHDREQRGQHRGHCDSESEAGVLAGLARLQRASMSRGRRRSRRRRRAAPACPGSRPPASARHRLRLPRWESLPGRGGPRSRRRRATRERRARRAG